MTGNEIRRRFLEHFERREHKVLPSAPLVPHGDPSTLFISAGMQPLQPYYLGFSRSPAPRLASAQKCLRTGDIEEVGKTDRHNTFFEMLGNFAPTGDYFKEVAIPLAWELVTKGFGMPVERLRVTVHPSDDEAFEIWTSKTAILAEHVTRLGDNWWGLGRGPCGPDSELWWDRGRDAGCGQADCIPDHCARFTEFWNLVFPQYDQRADLSGPPSTAESIQRGIADGALVPLARPAIDTGMGLERISFILQGKNNVFETDLLSPLIEVVREGSKKPTTVSERIIADHMRAAVFCIADGVRPSNERRGYVLRRLIRRAALHGLKIETTSRLKTIVPHVVSIYGEHYPELRERRSVIEQVIEEETERFARTLQGGMEQFNRVANLKENVDRKLIPGFEAFFLHDTFGFPYELTWELAQERGMRVEEDVFRQHLEQQRARSRSQQKVLASLKPGEAPRSEFTGYRELNGDAAVTALRVNGEEVTSAEAGDRVEVFLDRTPFYAESGGQIGDAGIVTTLDGLVEIDDTQKPAEGAISHIGTVINGSIHVGEKATASVAERRRRQIMRHHSATHLLHKALRETLGEHVVQKGSWVGPDHTTFDIPLNRAITKEELERINAIVMDKIREALPFHERQMPYKQAVAEGAMHLFEEKYGDVVRVVCFGDWTCELCGGTHVTNTADIGPAVVVSESSIGSGLRRVDMVVGEAADALVRRNLDLLGQLARSFNVRPEELPERINALRTQLKEAERERDRVRRERIGVDGAAVKHGKVDYVAQAVDASSVDELKAFADRYLERIRSGIVTLVSGDKFVIKVSRDLTGQYDANRLKALFGKGGGPSHLVTGSLDVPAEEAFERLEAELRGG